MASDLSIYARMTRPTKPRDNQHQRGHFLTAGENPIVIATVEYNLLTYDPNLWRGILNENRIENPFALHEFAGRVISIPPRPLPGFEGL